LLLQIGEELNKLIFELERVAAVKVKPNMAILSLICNVERTSEILLRTFKVFIEEGINVSMMSQGASKVCVLGRRRRMVWMTVTVVGRDWGWWGGTLIRNLKTTSRRAATCLRGTRKRPRQA
jgi:hypothetical protein